MYNKHVVYRLIGWQIKLPLPLLASLSAPSSILFGAKVAALQCDTKQSPFKKKFLKENFTTRTLFSDLGWNLKR